MIDLAKGRVCHPRWWEETIRVTSGLLRSVVLVAPLLLIAIWGWAYFVACWRFLEAPGLPLKFTYVTRLGSTASLVAASYEIDLARGTAHFDHPSFQDSAGSQIAKVETLDIVGLDAIRGANQILHVRARTVTGRLRRLNTGQFELEQLLPISSKNPSHIPFTAEIDNAIVTIQDRAGNIPWQTTLITRSVHVAGLGADWIAQGRGVANGLGPADVRIENVAGYGLELVAETSGLEVAPLLHHFATTPDLKQLRDVATARIGSMVIRGPFRAFMPTGRQLQLEGEVDADMRNVSFRGYAVDSSRFRGLLTQTGASGELTASAGGARVDATGALRWDKTQRFGAQVEVTLASDRTLPAFARKLLPPGAGFSQAKYTGWVSYEPSGVRLSGEGSASGARYQGQEVTGASGQLWWKSGVLMLNMNQARYRGEAAAGVIAINTKTKQLAGAVSSVRVDLGRVASSFHLKHAAGEALVSAVLEGTLAHPTVAFQSSGDARVRTTAGKIIQIRNFQASGQYLQGHFALERAIINSPIGLAVASGSVAPSGKMAVTVQGRGLQPGLIDPKVSGSANFEARIAGTLADPIAAGTFEGYALQYAGHEVPALTAAFVLTKQRVQLTKFQAASGPSEVTGTGSWSPKSGAIAGQWVGEGIQLSDFLGPDYIGSIDFPAVNVSGTVKTPIVAGSMKGTDLVVRGVKIDSVNISARNQGAMVVVTGGMVKGAGGTVSISGAYDRISQNGAANATATRLDLSQLLPEFAPYADLSGTLTGTGSVQIHGNKLAAATTHGRLQNVAVNGTPVGDGPWTADLSGTQIKGTLEIGQLDRFFTLNNLSYDTESKEIGGQADMFNVRLPDLVSVAMRYLPDLSFDTVQALHSLSGQASIASSIAGTSKHPSIQVGTFQATGVHYGGANFGDLNARLSFTDEAWHLANLSLIGSVGQFLLSGDYDPRANMKIDGDFNGVSLDQLGNAIPALLGQTGKVNLSFLADGPSKSPVIVATVTADGLLNQSDALHPDTGLHVELNNIRITAGDGITGGISSDGAYSYRGFVGGIHAKAPFAYPATIPNEGHVAATVTLDQRTGQDNLKEIASLVGVLDPKRSSGMVTGTVNANGTPNALKFDGLVSLSATSLGALGIDNTLKSATAQLKLAQDGLSASVSGSSDRGGAFDFTANTPIVDLETFAESLKGGLKDRLLDNTIKGSGHLKGFTARQGFPGRTYVAGTADGTLTLDGTIRRPLIGGSVSMSRVDTKVPALQPSAGDQGALLINPRFDIKGSLANNAHVRSATADLYLSGAGAVAGSLKNPKVNADLRVEKGSIRLPASTVRLDQGGAVTLRYSSNQIDTLATLTVDLQGHTNLSAPTAISNSYERYDIDLGIKGDLLKEGGLNLTATSTPGGLSQERILAMLGQTDLFSGVATGLTSGGIGGGTERQLQTALIGYAIPSLLDPVTSGLARSLGLDYLDIQYSGDQQASFVFGLPLGRSGFSLQGSRELTQPPPGFPTLFDVELVYRPRRLPGILQSFSISLGADQVHPWKLAVQYGTRF